jgi:hypothetical protein
MKGKIFLTISGLCVACLTGTALAQEYPNPQNTDGGYNSPGYYRNGPSQPRPSHHQEYKKDRDKLSISVNLGNPYAPIITGLRGKRHSRGIQWIDMRAGSPVPEGAVVSGGQSRPPATFFVCRAFFHGGVHPGKLFDGQCNISWGGKEIRMPRYETLVSYTPLNWAPAKYGNVPPGAIEGGNEHGTPLFICQADYRGGTHTGKVIGQSCNFGWGGREVSMPYYNVLVR